MANLATLHSHPSTRLIALAWRAAVVAEQHAELEGRPTGHHRAWRDRLAAELLAHGEVMRRRMLLP